MCTSVCPVSLLAVVVVAWVVHPALVVCQCTTDHCHDDGRLLTAIVSRLQDTVEQLQGLLQRQINNTAEQLQQQLRDATEQQQKQLTKLTETLAKQEECMYCLLTSPTAKETIQVKCTFLYTTCPVFNHN